MIVLYIYLLGALAVIAFMIFEAIRERIVFKNWFWNDPEIETDFVELAGFAIMFVVIWPLMVPYYIYDVHIRR